MTKPYIFAHRGGMKLEIENTMMAFKNAVELGVGIETDLHLTKDNILVCFHDYSIEVDSGSYIIKNLTLKGLREISFQDGRKIPTLEDVFKEFKESKTLRYSCDIGNRKVGLELIKVVEKFDLFDQLEITDQKPRLLQKLRETNKNIKLVHTIPHFISNINLQTVKIDILHENNIKILNVKLERLKNSFKTIIDNGFGCYVWGVNTKFWMKKVLQMKYMDESVGAIYTDYPDVLLEIRNQIYS